MNKETALQIMSDQYQYLLSIGLRNMNEMRPFDVFTCDDGDRVQYGVTIGAYGDEECQIDATKIHVTHESTIGGEDMGSFYQVVMKIDHPIHGVGYISYKGNYDSWNGVNWDYGECNMVTPREVTKIEYK